jgi:hypothetical protein
MSVLGCLGQEIPETDLDTQYWICKNEDSEHHNKLCHDECYEDGNPYKYCWLLYKSMCNHPDNTVDITESCKIFENNP